jgi:peptide-methionine (S)-S-oxide reductase
VLVVYDPKKISYRRLVEYFFTIHDPTTKDSQGPDFGSQYRSAIFYTSPRQKEVAQSVIADLFKAHKFSAPVVTQIAPAEIFYPAEEYHQSYDLKKGSESCAVPLGR